jgi:hypothetical protein
MSCLYSSVLVFVDMVVSQQTVGTVWRVIFGGANFRGKSEKALRIILNFRDSNPVQGHGAAQTMMYM